MSDISARAYLYFKNGAVTATGDKTTAKDFTATPKQYMDDPAASTSYADIPLGAIAWTEVSYIYCENMSSTVGEDLIIGKSAVDTQQIPPGEAIVLRPKQGDSTVMRFKSLAGTPRMRIVATGATA